MKRTNVAMIISLLWIVLYSILSLSSNMNPWLGFIYVLFPCLWFIITTRDVERVIDKMGEIISQRERK